MQTESIFAVLLAAAAFLKRPIQAVASESIRDAYEAVKAYLRRKFGLESEATRALELATAKPESLVRKALLVEESASAGLDADDQLHVLVERLAALLPQVTAGIPQNVKVNGQGNRVQVAGRDIITVARHVQRAAITPDERHITVGQQAEVRAILGEVADRLAGEDGRPNYAGAHRMFQRRFNVASYLLLPRESFGEALAYLTQQRAIHRSRLRRRNPATYRNDFLRTIFSVGRELGWTGEHVYQFATAHLGLKRPVASLKQLGSVQLKSVAEALRRKAGCGRAGSAS